MDQVVSGLEDPNTNVKLAAVKCLHSLSRSVQQLRTSFQDTAVWKPIMKLLHDASDNMMTVASSALCNLLLEFSPSKEVNIVFFSLLIIYMKKLLYYDWLITVQFTNQCNTSAKSVTLLQITFRNSVLYMIG